MGPDTAGEGWGRWCIAYSSSSSSSGPSISSSISSSSSTASTGSISSSSIGGGSGWSAYKLINVIINSIKILMFKYNIVIIVS